MLLDPEIAGLSIAAVLFAALVFDGVFGEFGALFRYIPHPVAMLGALIGWFDQRLNHEWRGESARRLRGALVVAAMIALAVTVGWGLSEVARSYLYGWAVELAALTLLIAQRSLFDHVRNVARALDRDGRAGGCAAVAHIVGRDPKNLDVYGVARAAIESLAENFADGVVAPVFWYLLFGLPGLLVYKTVNTMDSMIGYRTARHAAFGMVAARLDDVLNYVPARIAAVMIVLASAFVPRGRPLSALRVLARDGCKHRSPNAGWPEAAMAGGIGVALAGPRAYDGRVENEPWVGGEFGARAGSGDIRRALHLFVVACLFEAIIVALLATLLVR